MADVTVRHLSKSFGETPVLGDVSLDIAHGEFLTLVGPSGCGKSTLLRIIAGLDHADSGSIAIGGTPVDDLPPKARDVAMVFQSYALYPYMTVAENISLPLTMRRLTAAQRLPLVGGLMPGGSVARASIAADMRSVASSLGLGHLLDRRPGQLSGGQRQRVALARAMVRQPAAFLMDEPLSNLDAKLRVQARAEISDLHRRLGATFIYVTHDQVEAMTMSDRVAVMLGGRLLQVASPQDIYDDPSCLEVATFIGSPEINLVPATARADGIEVLGRLWPIRTEAAAGEALTVGIRPEALALAGPEAPGRAALTGEVRHLERLGSDTLAHLEVAGVPKPVVLRIEPHVARSLDIGSAVTAAVQPARVLVFSGSTGRRVGADAIDARPRLAAHG